MDHRAGRKPRQQKKSSLTGKTYLFGIGINTYEHWGNLNNAVRDVEAIADILQQNYGVTLWKLLRNEEATRKQILRALREMMKEVKAPDSIIIYYAGHGHVDKETKLGAWVPTDGENIDTDLYIPNSTLRDFFQIAKAQHVLFISDACFSGSLLQERRSAEEKMVLTELAARPSRWVMCSGRHDEAVADGPRGGHSPFAQAILDELEHNQKQGLNAAALAQNVQLQSKQYYKDQLSDYGPVFNTGDMRGQLVFWLDGVPKSRVGRQGNVGGISHDDAATERNRINAAISNVADDIKEEDLRDGMVKEPNSSQPASSAITASVADIASNMVRISGGTFTMGCQKGRDTDCGDREKPAHEVTLFSFYLSKYQVTQAQWREVMGSDPLELYNRGCNECPVEGVSWDDIQKFLQKLNVQTGQSYRLPTEAEWEYAARGGNKSKGYLYSGSNEIAGVAWYSFNAREGNIYGRKKTTRAVGGKKANELGLYDMSGNVWEWCSDSYGEDYYQNSPIQNQNGPERRAYRVNRGGSWGSYSQYCRAAARVGNAPTYRSDYIGFRLARTPSQ